MPNVRILIVEDEPMYREAMRVACEQLKPEGAPAPVAVSCRRQAETELRKHYDMVFLDLRLDDSGSSAYDLVGLASKGGARVAVMSSDYSARAVDRASESGAHSFIQKNVDPERLREIVRDVIAGERHWPREPNPDEGFATRTQKLELLSPKERETLELLVTGLTNKEIAQKKGVSPETVKIHVFWIYRKLGVSNRAEAVDFYHSVKKD